jgi:hypothetical protein
LRKEFGWGTPIVGICYASIDVYGQSVSEKQPIVAGITVHVDPQAVISAAAILVFGGFLNGIGQDLWSWLRDRMKRAQRE